MTIEIVYTHIYLNDGALCGDHANDEEFYLKNNYGKGTVRPSAYYQGKWIIRDNNVPYLLFILFDTRDASRNFNVLYCTTCLTESRKLDIGIISIEQFKAIYQYEEITQEYRVIENEDAE